MSNVARVKKSVFTVVPAVDNSAKSLVIKTVLPYNDISNYNRITAGNELLKGDLTDKLLNPPTGGSKTLKLNRLYQTQNRMQKLLSDCVLFLLVWQITHERQERQMKRNTLDEVKQRMAALVNRKNADLAEIWQKQSDAEQQKADAEQALKDATERMDLTAYKKAEAAKKDAATAIAMYGARYDQLQHKAFMTEKESDAVIDSILQYEDALAADFTAELSERLHDLSEMLQEYYSAVRDAEDTIREWTGSIHANFRSRGVTYYADGTDRSPNPIPVRFTAYGGCSEAALLRDYLQQVEKKAAEN